MKLRQGVVFKSQRATKARAPSAARRATARARARDAGQDVADCCPDDPDVIEFAITALGRKLAKLTDGLNSVSVLGVAAGKVGPVFSAAPSRSAAWRRLFREAAE